MNEFRGKNRKLELEDHVAMLMCLDLYEVNNTSYPCSVEDACGSKIVARPHSYHVHIKGRNLYSQGITQGFQAELGHAEC